MGWCYCPFYWFTWNFWQMLWPNLTMDCHWFILMADIIAISGWWNATGVWCSWCYYHFISFGWCYMPLVADGIATDVWCGRCYYHLADVIDNRMEWIGTCYSECGRCNSHWVFMFYFNLSSVMLFRTSSHIWGRWYLPMFLFRDGLLTLMYIASFISLMRFWSSLPTMLKLSSVVLWHVMLLWP